MSAMFEPSASDDQFAFAEEEYASTAPVSGWPPLMLVPNPFDEPVEGES